MKKQYIALVVTQSSWGGAQRYVYDLALYFKQSGNDVCVIAGKNNSQTLLDRLSKQGIHTITLTSLIRNINPFIDVYCILQLLRIFWSHKFDVIHLNSSKAGVVGSIAAWIARCPCVIYTAHGFVFNEQIPFPLKWLYIVTEYLSSFFKDAIITVSEFDRKMALQYHIAPKRKLRTIWNGIDVTHDTYVERNDAQEYLVGDAKTTLIGKFVIGCVANFYANKGLSYLIIAMKHVVSKHPNAVLVLVGDGMLHEQLKNQTDILNLTQQIVFSGYKKDPEKYLRAFDLLVSSSLKEGLSYTILESARARVPIVATNVGGTPEIIHNHTHGLLVPPGKTRALVEAICYVIDNPKKVATYAIHAHERVTQEFDVEKMSEKTLALYREYAKISKIKTNNF